MQRKQPLSPQQFQDIYSTVPRLTVEIIVIHNNKVILVKRTEPSWNGQWHIPGGTVIYKETLIDAVKRIAQEELDIKVKILRQDGYIEYQSEEKERGFGWSIGVVFICESLDDINIIQSKWDENEISLFGSIPDNLIIEQKTTLKNIFGNYQNGTS